MTSTADTELEERLRAAVWVIVNEITQEESVVLKVTPTPQYVAALADLVYTQAVTLAGDIEAFAEHANRKVVSADDVLMMCRRNEGLKDCIHTFVSDLRQQKMAKKPSQ
ncbi:kinetochore component CENP-S-domain-containing protein [Lipomyces oligophaga]|uniref:kinetochore component CENP-S-domain-containing protein n=1 Tax=Lipomyces oligophaga TaxID=45792 RepID=UPI0034CEC47E